MTVVHDLRVDSIIIGERLRPLSETAVAEIAESMARVGQIQPITIRHPNVAPHLVTGHHRLIGARRLGWETISCVILPTDTTEDDCLQIEIAENLHRNALTKGERDRHLQLLAEVIRRKGEVSQQNASKPRSSPQGGRPQGIIAKVAEQAGLSKDTVRRALDPEGEQAKKAEAKRQREAEQAEFDRQRDEHAAALPDHIREYMAARDAAIDVRRQSEHVTAAADHEGLTPEQRIEELEENVRGLEAEAVTLRAKNETFGAMKVQFDAGGFEKVIAGKDEQIRALMRQVETESADKASWARKAKFWEKEAKARGWKPDVATIDTKTGEVRHA